MSRLYISNDLGTISSGNTVSKYEIHALQTLAISLNDEVIRIGNEQINPITYNLPDNPFLMDYLTMNKIADLLDDTNFHLTVDHAHLYGGPYSNTIRYLKSRGIKVTLTIDAHNRNQSINEFNNLGYAYPYNHIKNDKLWKIYSQFTKDADKVIVPSKLSKEFLIEEGVKEENIQIIPHGINIPSEDEIKPIPEQFTVGYIGAMGIDKGLIYIIKAWSQLNYPDSTLIIAGRDSKDIGPFIKKYATGGRFNLLGYVENIKDFYNKISVYIQPSVTEAWGMEVVEAMSYGRPVIVSDGCGAKDALHSTYGGFVVPKRDPKIMADKIDYLKNNSINLREMGLNAIKRSSEYSWDKIQQYYIDLWRSL